MREDMGFRDYAKQVPGARRLVQWLRREWARPRLSAQRRYWDARRELFYYQEVLRLARLHAPKATSVIDVGSENSPFIQQFDWIPTKVSLDVNRKGRLRGVRCVRGDFMKFPTDPPFDPVLCLQVLEHLPDPSPFARRLLECGHTVIVSVPYRWDREKEPSHVHDPVDEEMVRSWIGRPWHDQAIPRERDGLERLIVVVAGRARPAPAAAP
jgi:hypothetical protein